uniref:Uncharacterized protein n=1 Tax=Rangifer tarandus platyrhynchus TaxID=3082113 RepID=A0ACB0FA51_RANTA|nr:unnamed protein product [Rangifer tarandus platyrhynchus]
MDGELLTELGCNNRMTSTGKAIESHSLERLLVRSRAEQACVPHTEVFTEYGQPYDNREERGKTATVNSALTEQKQRSTDGNECGGMPAGPTAAPTRSPGFTSQPAAEFQTAVLSIRPALPACRSLQIDRCWA